MIIHAGNRGLLRHTKGILALAAPIEHQSNIDTCAFSPDGKTIVSGSADNTARLWDTATGKPLSPPLQHGDPVSFVAWSADSRTFLTSSADRTARLWTLPAGQPLGAPLRHPGLATGGRLLPRPQRGGFR